jgi:small neutral amino acid transporter SnatA (MarC family)
MLHGFLDGVLFLVLLLNPFLMTIYLLDLIRTLSTGTFARVLLRAFLISGSVYILFALGGEAVFDRVLKVRFAAFLIFGGLLFLVIGLRYVLQGPQAIEQLRGPPEHLAGSIAMPFMIGPATLSACILLGRQMPAWEASLVIVVALGVVSAALLGLKVLHDRVRKSRESLVERYVDVVGRASALWIGSIAVDMVLRGIELWRAGTDP